MLVLTRKVNQSIIIADGTEVVEVVVLDVRGEQVRLGIKASRNVAVHRKEIYEQIQTANEQASQTSPSDIPE